MSAIGTERADPLSALAYETTADQGPELVEVRVGGASPTDYDFVSPFGAVLLVINRQFGNTTEIALAPEAALKLAKALTDIANLAVDVEQSDI